MKRAWLGHGARAAQVVGALLLVGAGLRLMTVAVAEAALARDMVVAAAAPVPLRRIPTRTTSAVPAAVTTETTEGVAGKPVRLMIAVLAGSPRSEVFLNGVRLGFSPYVGDVACKLGESLRIEIVPPAQPLIVRHGTCSGGTLRIDD